MANLEFDEVVTATTAEASAARKQLGHSYAVEFKKEPDTFDPRKLIKLGREGLKSFLANVSVPARELDPPTEPRVEITDLSGTDRNWNSKQTVPLPFEFSAFLLGVVAGIGVIFGSALVFFH